METESWATFSETSDSEGCVDDLNDDENSYAYGDIPKLQFRKDVSKARWIYDLEMAEVVERKGKMWTTTGIVRNGKIYCCIEETLFLAEIGALHLLDENDTPLPLKDIYAKMQEKKHGCSWESFEAYKHLKALGYVIGRHGIPWTLKTAKVDSSAQGSTKMNNIVDGESRGSFIITEMFRCLDINEVQPVFDVYPPNSNFKKSSPGTPCFVLCFTSGRPPSKQEIEELGRCCGGCPLKFCNVDHGRVSFFSFNRVELPVLP
ncbi:uncharacterized protein [Coffea arabica]|uniref:Uncharacterized protein LOC113741244 isoform X1 n=2 Tax=Coffea arabica TaxID=13443 RepID=A0A6P6X3C7_COFAR|nr:uncharacterized protein LOC113741244 isoform X1 [Coffea arabica]